MIDFDLLCQTIEDWKAGRRPSAPIPGPTPAAPSAAYEQVDSGLVMMDGEGGGYAGDAEYCSGAYGGEAYGGAEASYGDGAAASGSDHAGEYGSGAYDAAAQSGAYGGEGSFVEQSYGQPISATEGYDETGAPTYVTPTGTPRVEQPQDPPPYAADEPAPYTEMIPTHEGQAPASDVSADAYDDEDLEDVEVDVDDDDEPRAG